MSIFLKEGEALGEELAREENVEQVSLVEQGSHRGWREGVIMTVI